MIISLYTSRVVLNALGVEDYGIYNIVGGTVALLSFLSSTMSVSTNRFLSIAIGKKDYEMLESIFKTANVLHIGLAVIILIIGETLGLWAVNKVLVFPPSEVVSVNILYQLSLFSICLTITQIPYDALIIAHEDIHVFAYLQILSSFLKLVIALSLLLFAHNRLIIYGGLVFLVSLIMRGLYIIYSRMHYSVCRFSLTVDKSYLKSLSSFAGWDILGQLGYSARQQGTNILLNVFFGATINAASGLATTVQGVITSFSNNIITAARPQIIKSYGIQDQTKFKSLIFNISQLSIGMILIVTIPLMLNLSYILKLWLGIVPDYCYQFTFCCLLSGIVSSFSSVLLIGIHAVGLIKYSSLCRNIIYILSLFINYIIFKFNFQPYWAYLIIVLAQLLTFINDSFILRKVISWKFIFLYFLRISLLLFTGFLIGYLCFFISIKSDLAKVFLQTIIFIIGFSTIVYLFFMDKRQKNYINNFIKTRFATFLHE